MKLSAIVLVLALTLSGCGLHGAGNAGVQLGSSHGAGSSDVQLSSSQGAGSSDAQLGGSHVDGNANAHLGGSHVDGNANAQLGDKPPQPEVRIGGETVQVFQSTYCWQGTCADYAAPEVMMKDRPIRVVAANASITFRFEGKQPTETRLSWSRGQTRSEATLTENSSRVPAEKGIYYYILSANWLKDPEKRISEGDSSYVFAVEVK